MVSGTGKDLKGMRLMILINKSFAGTFLLVATCLFTIFMLNLAGCATSKSDKFREEIRTMSDSDLLYYYHATNERAKDIEHDMRGKEYMYGYDPKHNVYSTPFSPGGEGYQLMKKNKMILEELNRRNIQP